MTETITEEKKPTMWNKKEVQILICIVLPLLIGTAGRLVIFLFENLPVIVRWIEQRLFSIADFIKQLMINSQVWWMIITFISNWILGVGILFVFVVLATIED